MDEQKLNKKLAEWVGFREVEHYDLDGRPYSHKTWQYPKLGEHSDDLPNFTESLDACFKWLVPKLYKLGYEYTMQGYTYHTCLLRKEGSLYPTSGHKSPALALCLAIEKLIDNEQVADSKAR